MLIERLVDLGTVRLIGFCPAQVVTLSHIALSLLFTGLPTYGLIR